MSEQKTALDLADRWAYLCRNYRCDDAVDIGKRLSAIPADAAEQIARLEAELAAISSEARKLADKRRRAR